MLFDTSQYLGGSSALMAEESGPNFDTDDTFDIRRDRQEQLQVNRVNERLIREREDEINHIVKSINDLNELFKDLASMVVDQVLIDIKLSFFVGLYSTLLSCFKGHGFGPNRL